MRDATSSLVVCVIEGSGFANRDRSTTPSYLEDGSMRSTRPHHGSGFFQYSFTPIARAVSCAGDVFVSILTDVDADEVAGDDAGETHATDVASANDGSPQWNACFVMHDKPADSPLIFIAADADVVDADDAIGYACTMATTGTRWLDLHDGKSGATRGKLRVQVANIATDAHADAVMARLLGWATAKSAESIRPDRAPAKTTANVAVRCAAGETPIGCQCFSSGTPGCARAETVLSQHNETECKVRAAPYVPSAVALPPCPPRAHGDDDEGGDDDEAESTGLVPALREGAKCAPQGWHPLPPAGVIASVRCAATTAFSSVRSVESERTLGHANDAAVAQCAEHETLLGCAISGGDGAAEGVGPEYVQGRVACVAYSGRTGTPTRAIARCVTWAASPEPPPSSGLAAVTHHHTTTPPTQTGAAAAAADAPWATLSLVVRKNFGFRSDRGMHAIRCPHPFTLTSCSCLARGRDCLGVQYLPARLEGHAVCNASVAKAPLLILRPFELYATCVWRGPSSRLDPNASGAALAAMARPRPTCRTLLGGAVQRWEEENANTSLLEKPWLPRAFKRVVGEALAQGYFDEGEGGVPVTYVLSLTSFVAGVLVTLLGLCVCRCVCGWCGGRGGQPASRRSDGRGDDEQEMLGGVGPRSDSTIHHAGEMRAQSL